MHLHDNDKIMNNFQNSMQAVTINLSGLMHLQWIDTCMYLMGNYEGTMASIIPLNGGYHVVSIGIKTLFMIMRLYIYNDSTIGSSHPTTRYYAGL